MHVYSINTEERERVYFWLAVLSIFICWSVFKLIEFKFDIIRFISPFVIYAILLKYFDKKLWRCEPVRKILGIKTPDLQSTCKECLKSSYTDFKEKMDVTLNIKQTWTKIQITLSTSTESSSSKSEGAFINVVDSKEIDLVYQYLNEPKAGSNESMQMHKGTATLVFDEAGKFLKGEYYSGRGRQTHGSLCFNK